MKLSQKYYTFPIVITLIFAILLSMAPLYMSAQSQTSNFTGPKIDFENPRPSNGDDKAWTGYNQYTTVTTSNGEMTAVPVETASGTSGAYWQPNSKFGGDGPMGAGAVSMQLKLTFKESPTDWGVMLAIRSSSHSVSSDKALKLYFYPHKVTLVQGNNGSQPLATLNKPIKDAYYNIEFLTIDQTDGTTDVFVIITDEQGNLVRNEEDTGAYTMAVEDVKTDEIPAGFISLWHYASNIQSYSMKQGKWTFDQVSDDSGNLIPDFNGTKVTFENPRLTTSDEDKAWTGGSSTWATSSNGVLTVTPPAGTKGMYWQPNSIYGGEGPLGNGGVAMKLKLQFQDKPTDWGAVLAIRSSQHSYAASMGLQLVFYPHKVMLVSGGNFGAPLASLSKPVKDAWYNIEFITVDKANGTTNIYVLITDEEGNVLKNDGDTSPFSMKVEGVDTTTIPAGFISMWTNGNNLKQYEMMEGEWTYAPKKSPYPAMNDVRCYNFSELAGLDTDGVREYWGNVGSGLTYAKKPEETLVTVNPNSHNGLYYTPCSPYGDGLQSNVAIAMTLSLDFAETTEGWCYMIVLKGDSKMGSWEQNRALSLQFFKNAIKLYRVKNKSHEFVAEVDVSLESGKNYNVEAIVKDNDQGTTDFVLKINDDNGIVLTDSANKQEITMSVPGIEGVTGAGYVGLFSYKKNVTGWRFGPGSFTNDKPDENGKDVVNSNSNWLEECPDVGEYDYAFAAIGDTQYLTGFYDNKLNQIYEYIRENAESQKIKFVFGLGDITERNSSEEWAQAKTAIQSLNGVVPYSVVRGNHESTGMMKRYLPFSEYETVLGGSFNGDILNTWQELIVGEMKYLVFALDYGPTDAVLNWASEIIEAHPYHNVIITTHGYLSHDGTLIDDNHSIAPTKTAGYNNGDDMWEKLVSKHSNIVMVLCGHDANDTLVVRESAGLNGNKVVQMMIDGTGIDAGTVDAAGMIAMFYFSEGGKKVQVRYYSTLRNQWFMAENQLQLELNVVGLEQEADLPIVVGAEDGKTYCGSVNVTVVDKNLESVTLNGKPVTMENGNFTVNPAEGPQSIVATDTLGGITTVTITVNKGHTMDGTICSVCGYDESLYKIFPALDREDTRYYNNNPFGITMRDGLDKYWSPVGPLNYTMSDNGNLAIVTPTDLNGLYFGPCSPYGGGLVNNIGMAITLGIDFKDGASEFGYQFILRGDQTLPSWNLSKGIVLLVYSDRIALCKVSGSYLPELVVFNYAMELGKNYNLEFVAIDNEAETTDIFVRLSDENGNIIRNRGDERDVTIAAYGVEGVSGEGYVSMFANANSISQCRFGTGQFAPSVKENDGETDEEPEDTDPVKYPSLDGVDCFDNNPLGITTQDGLDKFWAPISTVDYVKNAEGNLLTITPSGVAGLYFGPSSPYGGGLRKNVAMAMTIGVDFKDNAQDFGLQIVLKGNSAASSWGQNRGVVLLVYPERIVLAKAVASNTDLVELATLYATLEVGKNYNLEFIAVDNECGTTDIYVKLMDENGNLLANDSNSELSLWALGVEGVAGEGWITMTGNEATTTQYRLGTGKFSNVDNPNTGDLEMVSKVVLVLIVSILGLTSYQFLFRRKKHN